MRFADTNILLYAHQHYSRKQPKAQIALQLLDSGDLGLSVHAGRSLSTWMLPQEHPQRGRQMHYSVRPQCHRPSDHPMVPTLRTE